MGLLELLTGKSKKTSNPPKYSVPSYMTPKEYARDLIDSIKDYAEDINNSSDVFDFSYSFRHCVDSLKELIWLNEQKRVPMTPSPRSDLERMRANVSLTVDDFISRAMKNIPPLGCDRANELELLVFEIESDEIFSKILTDENRARLQQLKDEAKSIRNNDILKRLGEEPFLDCSDIDAMEVIVSLETHLAALYQDYVTKGLSPDYGTELFTNFMDACKTYDLPLAAEVRLDSLASEYSQKFSERNIFNIIDSMDGPDFEVWCSTLLSRNGFSNVEVTPGSGDHGVDVLAEKDGIHYAIQCKCYSRDLGNTPIQEVYAGKEMYRCQVGVVMTNRYFTPGAKALAEQTRVLLWDRDKLQSLIASSE